MVTKLTVHQDRAKSRTRERERERERDQTHSYWYIPSAPRVNYSLLVMGTTGMMKMAIDDGFPLWKGAGTGSQLVFVAIEACDGGTPDLGLFLEVSVFIRIFGVENKLGGLHEEPTRPEGAPSILVEASWLFWPNSFASGASSGP